jgi:hypothetical protein
MLRALRQLYPVRPARRDWGRSFPHFPHSILLTTVELGVPGRSARLALCLKLALVTLSLAVAGAAPAKPPKVARAPHVLSTSELKLLLVGTRVTRADLPVNQRSSDEPEYFGRNGFYGRAADNYEQRGKYYIANNLVCVSADDEKWCRFVLIDTAGDFWLIKTLAPPEFKKIKVTKSKL